MTEKIQNKYLKIEVKHFGAELSSIKTTDNHEYLWQANSDYWARHSPILFPIVGNLLDNTFTYKDKNFSMNQHGFARDLTFNLVKKENDSLSFLLSSNENTIKIYPFEFELYISYKLSESSILISYKVINKSKSAMLFSIGAHPAFNWPLEQNFKKEEYHLEIKDIKQAEHLKISSEGIIEVENSFDKDIIELNEKLFEDDALIFSSLKNKNISFKSKKSKKSISLDFEDFPYLGIWSKPTGSPFICLEPWQGLADFKNHNKKLENKKGIIKLEKSKTFETNYTIHIK